MQIVLLLNWNILKNKRKEIGNKNKRAVWYIKVNAHSTRELWKSQENQRNDIKLRCIW